MKLKLIFLILLMTFPLNAQKINDTVKIDLTPNVNWWAGIIREGHKMPLESGYEANLFGQCWRNQLQPLLLSTDGQLVWSEEPFRFEFGETNILIDNNNSTVFSGKVGNTLRDAYLYASKNFFPPNGVMPPK